MLLMAAVMLGLLLATPPDAVLPMSAGIFVLAWAGQFIGHHIEGKKPSFFDDVRFLLDRSTVRAGLCLPSLALDLLKHQPNAALTR